MFKIRVNDRFDFEILPQKERVLVNGKSVLLDIFPISKTSFHILHQNKSYNAELVEFNRTNKTCTVRVNSHIYKMALTDQFDDLLKKLGMDNLNAVKVSELKAPMPGLVLKVLVEEGEEVKKGANLVILEAMKMENIIKAPADVIVKSIKVKSADKVEKNQVMIIFK